MVCVYNTRSVSRISRTDEDTMKEREHTTHHTGHLENDLYGECAFEYCLGQVMISTHKWLFNCAKMDNGIEKLTQRPRISNSIRNAMPLDGIVIQSSKFISSDLITYLNSSRAENTSVVPFDRSDMYYIYI